MGFSELIAGAPHASWFLAREDDAERRRRHSHAESMGTSGNECEQTTCRSKFDGSLVV